MVQTWDNSPLASSLTGLNIANPQVVFSGSGATVGSSSLTTSRQGMAFVQYEGVGATFTSFVIGRIIGSTLFFTMSLSNASIGNNTQTLVTASGLYVITPTLSDALFGNLEFKPVVTTLSAASLDIMTSYTVG